MIGLSQTFVRNRRLVSTPARWPFISTSHEATPLSEMILLSSSNKGEHSAIRTCSNTACALGIDCLHPRNAWF